MTPSFRPATHADLPAILHLVSIARQNLKAQGLDQWQDGYPDAALLAQDIGRGESFLLEGPSGPLATAALCFGPQPEYDTVYGGTWQVQPPCAALHRVAVDSTLGQRGLATALWHHLAEVARGRGMQGVRGDTHPGNKPMQGFFAKNGFARRGTIHLADGALRIAYDISFTQ